MWNVASNLCWDKFRVDQFAWYTPSKASDFTRAPVCRQIAHKYLVEKHLSPADETQFKEQLYRIWFELYARRGSSRWVDAGTAPKSNLTDGIWHHLSPGGTSVRRAPSKKDGSLGWWNGRRSDCVCHQARFFRLRARVRWRDERTTDRHRISQLDPALPAGEAGAHWLQRLQCYCKLTPGMFLSLNKSNTRRTYLCML